MEKDRITRKQTKALDKIYSNLIAEISAIYHNVKLREDQLFLFRDQRNKARATEAFRTYRKATLSIITQSQAQAWELAQINSRQRIVTNLQRLTTNRVVVRPLNTVKELKLFQDRKIKLSNISSRVWDITDLSRQNIEIALSDALNEGKSAQQLARTIKRNLKNPDALFRRVKDAKGRLVPSKAMRVYKPGQGIYKSAHKNALRLARNEINLAYAKSEQLYMKNSSDIVAQRINTSPTGNEVCEICTELAGVYPVTFIWNLFHVQCRCTRTFILKTDKEFREELKTGKTLKIHYSDNYVHDIPDNFKNWVSKNKEVYKNRKTQPSFLKDNGYLQ